MRRCLINQTISKVWDWIVNLRINIIAKQLYYTGFMRCVKRAARAVAAQMTIHATMQRQCVLAVRASALEKRDGYTRLTGQGERWVALFGD